MKKKIYKMFWIWDFDREEKWLNDMSAKGMQLCDVGYCRYTFEEGLPNEYVYRLELLNNMPAHEESKRYINFIEDTGAEQIGSLFRWVYFRKKKGSTEFNLLSDIDSRIKHLNRILVLAGIFAGLNLFNGLNLLAPWHSSVKQEWGLGALCLAVGLLIGCGFVQLFFKRNKLKREKILHE